MTLLTQVLDLFVIVTLVTCLWYLGAHAGITYKIREKLVRWQLLYEWLVCPACCSVWYGAALALVADLMNRPVLGLNLPVAVPVMGFICMKWVPWMARQLLDDLSKTTEYLAGDDDGEK